MLPYGQIVAWQANPQTGQPVWEERRYDSRDARRRPTRPRHVPFDDTARDLKRYDVVISNRAAWLLAHTSGSKIQLRCTRSWPPPAQVGE